MMPIIARALLFLLFAVGLTAVLSLYLRYRRDLDEARAHLDSIERQAIETECGPIEVAVRGRGQPMLVSHGIAGGVDQGLGLVRSYIGAEYAVIIPSRFGYVGTPMPLRATPVSQADAFVCLLDSLKINKVTVAANSAGGTSALQMALRHPQRIHALILISSAAPTVGRSITLPPKPVIQLVFSSDFLMWLITTHFQSNMRPAVGIPNGYQLSDSEQAIVSTVIRSVVPIRRRTAGFVFDMFTSNTDMDQHPEEYQLENIRVPTLVIHALDDPLAKYENAAALAARIPNAEMFSVRSGGHLLLGSEAAVRAEIARFLRALEH